jgi:site-specific DNA-methyltransferase (adenine-specific)
MTAPQINSNTPQLLTESIHLHCGNNVDVLRSYPDCHFDAIVTDPPYGIEFLGKAWDNHTGAMETWQQCLRVLKPGGYLLAFSAARTYHHLATNIESTGFEIRDQLMWIYSSGFPKAQDVGKSLDKRGIRNQSHGWKTALKPGHEPIVMARKPFKGSAIDNVIQLGVGALNIDATRIPFEDQADMRSAHVFTGTRTTGMASYCEPTGTLDPTKTTVVQGNVLGRYPSNVLGEIANYQKYFYCPKVSRRERHVGFEQSGSNLLNHLPTESSMLAAMGGYYVDAAGNRTETAGKNIWTPETGMVYVHGLTKIYEDWCQTHNQTTQVGNNHPTVKPVALMRYLIQLVTPARSKVLDPFMGSGSTGMAARELGHTFVGIDLDPRYVEIAHKRIMGWVKPKDHTIKTVNDSKSTDLWDDLFE